MDPDGGTWLSSEAFGDSQNRVPLFSRRLCGGNPPSATLDPGRRGATRPKPRRSRSCVTWVVDREGRSGGKEGSVKRLAIISLILGTALTIVPLASAMVLSDGSGGGSLAAAPTGVQLTGKDLAAFYDTGAVMTSQPVVPLSGKDLAGFYDTGAVVTSQPVVSLSGKDLAAFYDTGAVVTSGSEPTADTSGNGVTLHTDILGGNGAAASTPSSSGDSFEWNSALAATLAGMLLLAIAATAITRRKHRLSY